MAISTLGTIAVAEDSAGQARQGPAHIYPIRGVLARCADVSSVRQVEIAPEVAALLGPEQCARLSSDDWDQPVQCWECDGWLAPAESAVVLILRRVDLGQGTIRFAVHAHPRCADSEVREVTLAELQARDAELGLDAADSGTSVDVVATVWDLGNGAGYPVVLISFQTEVMIEAGPERMDAVVSALLRLGWHLVSHMDQPPPSGPEGYRLRFTHAEGHAAAAGLVELIDPAGEVETSAYVQPGRFWRPGALRTGRSVVILGSRYLTEWATRGRGAVKRAARAGALVGGVVPVDLVGPGND